MREANEDEGKSDKQTHDISIVSAVFAGREAITITEAQPLSVQGWVYGGAPVIGLPTPLIIP
jgi:hypothetical protein